jgi:hypothetical protein
MNLRHATALALVGWYLIVPPIARLPNSCPVPDMGAPISKWTVREGFDEAKDCNLHQTIDFINGSNVEKQAAACTMKRAAAQAMEDAQCIFADDPGLAK